MMGYYQKNAWWVSPFNFVPEVVAATKPTHQVELQDLTMRDGEQTPGVVFRKEEKIRIAEKLIEFGVTRMQTGMVAVSQEDRDAMSEIAKRHPEARTFTIVRPIHSEIDMAADCGVYGLSIDIPIGEPKLKFQHNGWTWEDVYEKVADATQYARSKGLYVVLSQYDTSRAVPEDLVNHNSKLAQTPDCCPDAFSITDTMGCLLPEAAAYMVRLLKKATGGKPIEIHSHNDFGMATAIELAAMSAGADVLHCCANGIGERTGNAALEELVLAMKILMGMDVPYRLDKMQELCELVSELSGVPIHQTKAFSGRRNYMRESGMGVNLVLNEPLAMFATDPRYFDKQGEIVLGKKSGRLSIQYYIDKLNLTVPDEAISDIVAEVKARGIEKKGLLSEEEFVQIASAYLK